MHMAACRDVALCFTDRKAVLDDLLPRRNSFKRNLVPCRNILQQGYGHTVRLGLFTLLQGHKGNSHIVRRGDSQQLSHLQPPKRSVITVRAPRLRMSSKLVATLSSKPGIFVRS